MLNALLPPARSGALSLRYAIGVFILSVLVHVTPAVAQRADAGAAIRGVLVVKTRALPSEREPAAMPAPRALALLREAGLRSLRLPLARGASSLMSADRHGLRRIFEVRYDADIDPRELALRLEATGEIEYAEPMPVRTIFSTAPNDSAYASQYALQLIDAEGAWAVTRGDTSVVIGIVDTGLDWEHEDLAANIWRNPGEIAGNGIDDDGNGYVDDVRGWDFIGGATMSEIEQGIFHEDNDPKVRVELTAGDIRNHGTHVGGIVAATGDNARGIAGVAYGCRLMPVKTSSDSGATYIFRGYEGILYCARNGADVVNCSWGGSTASKVEADVVAEALDLGCLVVVAAGNSSYNMDALDFFPALIPGVVAVGASTRDESEAFFSNYGVATTVFAPGSDVLSTVAGNGYAGKSGTSMASPVVAGVAALVRSVRPDWSPAMVASQLRSTSDSILRGSERNRPAYYGRVNARRAVTENVAAGAASIPGVTLVARRWLDGAGDTLRDNGTHRLALTLRNNLATTRALFVSIAPIDPQIAVLSAGTLLDSIGRGAERVVEVDVRIPQDSLWRAGTLALRIGLRDTAGYSDYLITRIPFELPATTRAVDITSLLGEIDLDEVDSPTPEVAWISGDRITGQSTIIRIVDGTTTSSSVALSSPVRVRAFDSSHCIIWSGTRIGMTDDGGGSWRYDRIDTAVTTLDRFLLFSQSDWCVVGRIDKPDSLIAYAFTRDAGLTWTRDTVRLDSVGASGVNYDATWRGRTGLIALGSAGILRTEDAGASWRRLAFERAGTVSRIALWNELRGMLVVSWPSGTRIAATSDGGETWTTSPVPYAVPDGLGMLATPSTGATSYMIGRAGSVGALSDGDVRRQIPATRLRTRYRDVAASASDSLVRIWHVGPVAGYVDIPLRTITAPAREERIGLALTSIHPMPASDRLDVRLSGASGRGVTLEVIDLLGRTLLARSLATGSADLVTTLAIGELAPGRYLLRARDGGRSVARAFVITR